VVGDVFCDNRAGTDEGVAADGVAADDGAVGTECCAFFDEGGTHLVHFADFRTRVEDVGKDHRGAAEDAVFQGDAFVNGDIVLNFTFVADDGVGADDDVLADVAVFSYFRSGKDVGEMPDLRFFANFNVVVDDSCFVGEKTSSRFNVQRFRFYVRRTRFYVQGSRFKVEGTFFFLFKGVLAEF